MNPTRSFLAGRLPRTVIALGVVSLLTDLSSEMIYPLLPVFLSSVLGAGTVALGLIEGVAESTASLLKVFSGIWTDRTRKRKPLIVAGYGLSGLMRPFIGVAMSWPMVLFLRFADRVGKGLRTSPRDALIADVTAPARRGEAYGFHRAMDHGGAVLGPLVAAALLAYFGFSLRAVFLWAAVPAAVVLMVLLVYVPEPAREQATAPRGVRPGWYANWRNLGRDYRMLLLAVVVFTLGNSTDAFLLLRLTKAGVPAAWVAVLWSAQHVIKMASTYIGGRLSDKTGRRALVVTGWAFYALVYLLFGCVTSAPALIGVFLAYGLYYGLTEPTERAWVSDLVPQEFRGAAFGYYHGVTGLAALPASLVFGFLWQQWGAPVAFLSGAGLALLGCALLLRVGRGEALGDRPSTKRLSPGN